MTRGHARQLEKGLPPFKDVEFGLVLHGLGRRREKRPKRHVIRPGLTRFHREMAAVVTGHADLHGAAKFFARLLYRAIALTKVDTVGAQPLG